MKIQTVFSHNDICHQTNTGIAVLLQEGFAAQDYAALSTMTSINLQAYLT
jgi:hypothetical protein